MTTAVTKGLLVCAIGMIVVLQGCTAADGNPTQGQVEIQSEEEKTLYALGLTLGGNVASFSLNEHELTIVLAGLNDSVTGAEPRIELKSYAPKIRELAQARAAKRADDEKDSSRAFVAQVSKEEGASTSASGLVYVEMKKGSGASPQSTQVVKVHYRGTLMDGTQFDSSYDRGEPAQFPLTGVIPCWTEGLQKMSVGGKAKLVCPSDIAYGDAGRPPLIPPGATLVFEVELLEIVPG